MILFAFEKEQKDYPVDMVIFVDNLISMMTAAIVTKSKE